MLYRSISQLETGLWKLVRMEAHFVVPGLSKEWGLSILILYCLFKSLTLYACPLVPDYYQADFNVTAFACSKYIFSANLPFFACSDYSHERICYWNNWSLLESFNLFPLFYFFFFSFIFVSQVSIIVVVEGLLDWIYCVSSRERVFFPWICGLS